MEIPTRILYVDVHMRHVSLLLRKIERSLSRVRRQCRERESVQNLDAIDEPFRHADEIAEELGDSTPRHAITATETDIQPDMRFVRSIAPHGLDIVVMIRGKVIPVLDSEHRSEHVLRIAPGYELFCKVAELGSELR